MYVGGTPAKSGLVKGTRVVVGCMIGREIILCISPLLGSLITAGLCATSDY